ncbi:hypothetical protein CPB86DRAFT_309049 [Serendipita vermifera]|nr:hypothetical protein CPB86DRAFT_309049 [Serendipita vermifera]
MATFESLPTEILLTIIELLAPDKELPVVGYNAVWVNPAPPLKQGDKVPTHSGVMTADSQGSSPTDLASLQLTNQRLHALCTPFLRRDLNLLTQSIAHDKFALEQASKYFRHIRTLRVFLDHRYPSGASDDYQSVHEKCVEDIFLLCTQVDSISIYYHSIHHIPVQCRPTCDFAERLFDIMTKEGHAPIKSLGIYCIPLLQDSGFPDPAVSIERFLSRILSSPYVVRSLEHFDVVAHHLSTSPFPPLPLLKSFSLYRSWASGFEKFWTTQQLSHWIQQSSLVRLHLINCTRFHASDIPNCVAICPSLQHVVISACGRKYPVQLPSRTPGWSKEANVPSNKRSPLLSFHIEYVEHSDIVAFGSIPTLYLSIASVYEGHVERAFLDDGELFPRLQKLSLENKPSRKYRNHSEQSSNQHTQSLEDLCKERGIDLARNSRWLVNKLS